MQEERGADPALLLQPRQQWSDGRSAASPGFVGYKPGTVPFEVDTLTVDPTFIQRLKAAALDVPTNKKWTTLD